MNGEISFTTPRLPLMAPGLQPAAKHAEVFAPYDCSSIATVEQADRAGVDQALETAYGLFRNRDAWLSPARRIEILERTGAIMQGCRDELALLAAREGGKPLIDSQVEADRAIDGVKLCVEHLRTQGGREIPMNLNTASTGRVAFTQYEPIGVVVAFSAFNHPLNLIVHQVGPAVAAGCPVIVKPAEATPLSCMRFVEILREAGLPEEWCQALLTTDRNVAGTLMSDPRVGFFSFIGSARVGWMLRSKLAPGTRCALEHGGAAPVLIEGDCCYTQSDAVLRIVKHLGGLWRILVVLYVIPRPLRNRLYALIAQKRYKWFGKKDSCMVATGEAASRFLQ